MNLAREYAAVKPAAIRRQLRHAAALPAAAWRRDDRVPAGARRRVARSRGRRRAHTADFYNLDHKALERPDLIRGKPRTINQSKLGDALTSAEPPVKAIYVYNNNPVAVCPDSNKVIAGFSRPDLFTVVHEVFLTDTCDYADIVLPATTQLEHYDIHKSYGHLYVVANTRRSRRSARPSRTSRSSACWRSAWDSTSRASTTPTRTCAARRSVPTSRA